MTTMGRRLRILLPVWLASLRLAQQGSYAFAPTSIFTDTDRRLRYTQPPKTMAVEKRTNQLPKPLLASLTPAMVVGHVIGGALAAPLTAKAIKTWYTKIPLPTWTPPNRIFGPVWTLLYASMGYSAARIVKAAPSPWYQSLAMQGWIMHCVLNILWAPVFFGLRQFRLSAIINVLLLTSMGGVVLPLFAQIDRTAAVVLLPYTAWLVFANALNLSICRLNPGPYNSAKFESDLARLQREAAIYAGLGV